MPFLYSYHSNNKVPINFYTFPKEIQLVAKRLFLKIPHISLQDNFTAAFSRTNSRQELARYALCITSANLVRGKSPKTPIYHLARTYY